MVVPSIPISPLRKRGAYFISITVKSDNRKPQEIGFRPEKDGIFYGEFYGNPRGIYFWDIPEPDFKSTAIFNFHLNDFSEKLPEPVNFTFRIFENEPLVIPHVPGSSVVVRGGGRYSDTISASNSREDAYLFTDELTKSQRLSGSVPNPITVIHNCPISCR